MWRESLPEEGMGGGWKRWAWTYYSSVFLSEYIFLWDEVKGFGICPVCPSRCVCVWGGVMFVQCFGWCHFMKHPLYQLIQTPLENADVYAATLASQLGEPTWNCAFTMNNSGYILLATRTCDGPSAERLRATSAVTLTGICRLFSQCGKENVPSAQLFPQLTARHLKGNEL